MESVTVRPDAKRMIEGLRDAGYEFNTAIADLIDNSIAAKATEISVGIDMDYQGNIIVSIADNGTGMNREDLISAMKYGSPPRPDKRSLGKFGLGLKTASTAFCRYLSVISRPSAKAEALKAVWDLDHVAEKGDWDLLLGKPDQEELNLLNKAAKNSSGTLVVWAKVDRLMKDYSDPGGKHARNALDKKIESLNWHLATVYQRFLDKTDKRERQKIRLWVNNKAVQAWDPFCVGFSQVVGNETVPVGPEDSDKITGEFVVRAFVLPRREEFPNEAAETMAKISNEYQGIYIYRENRLIHGPDWLGKWAQEPHGSLLRVEFSFPADLDETFRVDIKKSRIDLQEELYAWLFDEFLPPFRRAADDRYRKGLKKQSAKAAAGAHTASNRNIGSKDAEIDKAVVKVIDAAKGQVEVANEQGKTRLKIKVTSASKPGEMFVQAVDSLEDGHLWAPAIIDNHQGVQINNSHDFYQKIYLPNIVSKAPSQINVEGLDALLWALGVAEYKAVSEATKSQFRDMRYEVSRILRKLVENLPEPPDTDKANSA